MPCIGPLHRPRGCPKPDFDFAYIFIVHPYLRLATSPTPGYGGQLDMDIVVPGNRFIAMVHYWVRHAKCTWSSFYSIVYLIGTHRTLWERKKVLWRKRDRDNEGYLWEKQKRNWHRISWVSLILWSMYKVTLMAVTISSESFKLKNQFGETLICKR